MVNDALFTCPCSFPLDAEPHFGKPQRKARLWALLPQDFQRQLLWGWWRRGPWRGHTQPRVRGASSHLSSAGSRWVRLWRAISNPRRPSNHWQVSFDMFTYSMTRKLCNTPWHTATLFANKWSFIKCSTPPRLHFKSPLYYAYNNVRVTFGYSQLSRSLVKASFSSLVRFNK